MPEVPFVPGVDPQIRVWKEARERVRNYIKTQGNPERTIPSKSRYTHRFYWENQFRSKYLDNGPGARQKTEEELFIAQTFERALSTSQFLEAIPKLTTKQALLLAMQHRHNEFIDHLLTQQYRGINLNSAVDYHGMTLLHYAVADGDVDKVIYLLSKGAKVNARDIHRRTPLFKCISLPKILHPPVVLDILCDARCNINIRDERGYTALHQACILNDLELIEHLLQRGAKVSIKDHNHKVAFQHLKETNKRDAAVIFNRNTRFCGRSDHHRMWAHITSIDFVTNVLSMFEQACPVCKRKYQLCSAKKKEHYKLWLYTHNKFATK